MALIGLVVIGLLLKISATGLNILPFNKADLLYALVIVGREYHLLFSSSHNLRLGNISPAEV